MRALKVSKDVERMVMGGNGAKLLGIPHQKLVGTSARAKAPVAV
jgi:hypothetical protein